MTIMRLNTKIIATAALLSGVVLLASMSSVQQQEKKEEGFKNLKVLPKHITERQLDAIMSQWSRSLGVRCNFCHAQDRASDEKPEKLMTRKMFEMTAKINSKWFDAQKDSLGMRMQKEVSCYTCHRGASHPEVKLPPPPPRGQGGFGGRGPGGPPNGAPNGQPMPAGPGSNAPMPATPATPPHSK